MIILHPISHKPNRENVRTTRLFFRDEKSANFYVNGAIAWPEGKYPGFVLLSGQNLDDPERKIWIFSEQEFWTVDNWIDRDGNLKENRVEGRVLGHWYGIGHFVSQAYATCGCIRYFYGGQHPDVHKRHLERFYKSRMIPRVVEMIQVPYVKEVGDDLIKEYVGRKLFVADGNSRLAQLMKTPEEDENNGKHVLKALFAGYEKNPWIDTTSRAQPIVEYIR